MKYRLLLAVAALTTASPAHATGGMLCSPVSGTGPEISLTIGHGAPIGVIGASLTINGRTRSTQTGDSGITIAQAWLDREQLMVDIADANLERIEARLRIRFGRSGEAMGTLEVGGRTARVRCEEA